MTRFTSPHLLQVFALFVCLFGLSDIAFSQVRGLQPGEAVISRFGGTKPVVQNNQKTEHKLDLNGIVASIVDLRNPGQKPVGQHWENEPQRSQVFADEVGQVFGIALDDASPPNIYLSATSTFGLFRTRDNAGWMKGMWGKQGGPGTVYKLDAKNNYRPEVFAKIALDGRANGGTGLGNIAYDRINKQLFVSDLETGMIHRLDISTGEELGVYDHGVEGRASFFDVASGKGKQLQSVKLVRENRQACEDLTSQLARSPACWHYTSPKRRVWGLGVHVDEAKTARLYYAIWGDSDLAQTAKAGKNGARNTIWSVGIGPAGAFDLSSVRREFSLPLLRSSSKIKSAPVDIAFSKFGEMLVGERGEPSALAVSPFRAVNALLSSRVLQFRFDGDGMWIGAGQYEVGNKDGGQVNSPVTFNNAAGGVSWGYGYGKNGRIDLSKADGFVWISGDGLCSATAPCFDLKSEITSNGDHVTGIEGRGANQFKDSIDGSYKIDSDLNVDENGNKVEQIAQRDDDSRGAGDVEVFVLAPLNGKVASRKQVLVVKAIAVDIPEIAKQEQKPVKKFPVVAKKHKRKLVRLTPVKRKKMKKRAIGKKLKRRNSVRRKKPRVRKTGVTLFSGGRRSEPILQPHHNGKVNIFAPSPQAK